MRKPATQTRTMISRISCSAYFSFAFFFYLSFIVKQRLVLFDTNFHKNDFLVRASRTRQKHMIDIFIFPFTTRREETVVMRKEERLLLRCKPGEICLEYCDCTHKNQWHQISASNQSIKSKLQFFRNMVRRGRRAEGRPLTRWIEFFHQNEEDQKRRFYFGRQMLVLDK